MPDYETVLTERHGETGGSNRHEYSSAEQFLNSEL